tara:strand:+ start:73427 stop:74239 length:813 start_codon:yes stop_codon:yes gene_type:complete
MKEMTNISPDVVHERLSLPKVTLCAATSVNVSATVRALEACLEQIDFAACKLFTDAAVVPDNPEIEVIPIMPMRSSAAYSDFLLRQMVDHVETSHCLIVQWDGHVLDARKWRAEFLEYDYIGARWPQFSDGHEVGNGGFSLRSRRLMLACREPEFQSFGAEDMAICRTNRIWLEGRGMRFASAALADVFAAERAGDLTESFGYHGVFNMPRAIGVDNFWRIYGGLDDRGTVWHDFRGIMRDISRGSGGLSRAGRMIIDRLTSSRSRKGDH